MARRGRLSRRAEWSHMFVGHLAVGLVAKRVAPRVNLGWLIAGVCALDLVWPILVLAGVERVRIVPGATAFTPLVFESYPWSHSLVMATVWGVGLAAVARARGVPSASLGLLVLLAVSHWVLDVVTHAPDLPLWPGSSPRFGLTLWNSIPLTFAIEGAMWIAAILFYLRITASRSLRSRVAFWSLVVVTTVLWALSPWSPPPSPQVLGWFALVGGWITVPWAAAADAPQSGASWTGPR